MSAVGGVTPENIEEFIKCGITCFGIGSNLVDLKAIAAGTYDRLAETANQFTTAIIVPILGPKYEPENQLYKLVCGF